MTTILSGDLHRDDVSAIGRSSLADVGFGTFAIGTMLVLPLRWDETILETGIE